MPFKIVFLVERNISQTATSDLQLSWDGVTSFGHQLGAARRFMWNETGDRVIQVNATYNETWQTMDPSGRKLSLKSTGAFTTDAIHEANWILYYHVWDVS